MLQERYSTISNAAGQSNNRRAETPMGFTVGGRRAGEAQAGARRGGSGGEANPRVIAAHPRLCKGGKTQQPSKGTLSPKAVASS